MLIKTQIVRRVFPFAPQQTMLVTPTVSNFFHPPTRHHPWRDRRPKQLKSTNTRPLKNQTTRNYLDFQSDFFHRPAITSRKTSHTAKSQTNHSATHTIRCPKSLTLRNGPKTGPLQPPSDCSNIACGPLQLFIQTSPTHTSLDPDQPDQHSELRTGDRSD